MVFLIPYRHFCSPLFIFTIAFFTPVSVYSQQYNIRNYTIEDGLPQTQVMDILQDHNGFIWVATNGGGIAKFTGTVFIVYTTENGLSDNRINCIIEDKKNRLWMATANGVCCYDGKKFIRYGKKEGLDASMIFTLAEDKQGNIWAGSEKKGLFVMKTEQFEPYDLGKKKSNEENQTIRILLCDSKNRVWAGADEGLFCIENRKINFYQSPGYNLCGNGIWSLLEDHRGYIWIGTYGQYFCFYNGNGFFSAPLSGEMNDGRVITFMEDGDNALWAGTDGGGIFMFSLLPEDSLKITGKLGEKNGLANNRIRCIFKDNEKNTWIGTDNGLSRFDNGKLVSYSTDEGLPSKVIHSVFEDRNGTVWLGTQQGVVRYDGNRFENFTVNGYRPTWHTWCIYQDHDGKIWFGTFGQGAFYYDGKSLQQISFGNKKLNNDVVYAITEDHNGRIWLGTDYGLSYPGTDSVHNFSPLNGLEKARVRSLYCDKKNNLWIGTRTGLVKYTASEKIPTAKDFRNIRLNDKIDGSVIFSIVEDSEQQLWFGVYGYGLVRFNPADESFVIIEKKDGLSHNGVLSVVKDNDYLWIGTINGINRFDLETYLSTKQIVFRHFGKAEGFRGVEVNQNASMRDSKGNTWFGTSEGVVKYNRLKDYRNNKPPKIYITDVKLFSETPDWERLKAEPAGEFNLPVNPSFSYDQNHLTFGFIGLNYTAPEKVKYMYKVEGIDKAWSKPTGETQVTYPGLPPGDYHFMVKACNNEGMWNETPAVFSFIIRPPFWKTTWFLVLCLISGSGIILLYITFRTRKLRQAKRKLEKEVRIRTRQLHEKNKELEEQKKIIEQKNTDITDSITYARHIQDAIFPAEKLVKSKLPGSFIFFQPKDILSGDFYWVEYYKEHVMVAAVDCTGHGVPGAMVSVVCSNALNRSVRELGFTDPRDIIIKSEEIIRDTFSRSGKNVKDGMDISMIVYNEKSREVRWWGFNNPLWLIHDSSLSEFHSQKNGEEEKFSLRIEYSKGSRFYIFTDGYADQFGGPDSKKLKTAAFKKILLESSPLSLSDQKKQVEKKLNEWKGGNDQTDDICVIGIEFL